jgi:hypothetical protein
VRDFRNAHEGLGPLSRGYFDEGMETNDWLLTQHTVSAPVDGNYIIEIGLAHRDRGNPDAVTAGLGSVRVPLSIHS